MSENGLEALETVKYECGFAFGQTANGDKVRESLPIIEKELKALEVLKKKTVNVRLVKALGSLEEYNNMYADSRSKFPELTQDEFELLREVMR